MPKVNEAQTADRCPYGQKDCPGGAQCVCALPVDTHDAAGMARWLRERAKANRETLEPVPGGWLLPQWRVNLMPHIAFRLEQAANEIERQARALTETHDAWTAETTRRLQAQHERDCAVEDVARLTLLLQRWVGGHAPFDATVAALQPLPADVTQLTTGDSK